MVFSKSNVLVIAMGLVGALGAHADDNGPGNSYYCDIVRYVSKQSDDHVKLKSFEVGVDADDASAVAPLVTGKGVRRVEWKVTRAAGFIHVEVKKAGDTAPSIYSTPEGMPVGVELMDTKNILTCNLEPSDDDEGAALVPRMSIKPSAYGESSRMAIKPSAYGEAFMKIEPSAYGVTETEQLLGESKRLQRMTIKPSAYGVSMMRMSISPKSYGTTATFLKGNSLDLRASLKKLCEDPARRALLEKSLDAAGLKRTKDVCEKLTASSK